MEQAKIGLEEDSDLSRTTLTRKNFEALREEIHIFILYR